mgnify:CR=1 FL=1
MFPLPLVLTVHPSRRLRWTVTALHLAAAGAVWLAALPVSAQLAGTALIGASLAMHRRTRRQTTLRADAKGKLEIRENGAWQAVAGFQVPLRFPQLTLLRYTRGEQRRTEHLAILPDGLSEQDFRRLRVWLRWLGGNPGIVPGPAHRRFRDDAQKQQAPPRRGTRGKCGKPTLGFYRFTGKEQPWNPMNNRIWCHQTYKRFFCHLLLRQSRKCTQPCRLALFR